MTTYTITEAQRQQLLDLAMPVVSTPNRIALKLLRSLTPNSEEPTAYGVFHKDGSAHIFQQQSTAQVFGEAQALYLHPAPSSKPADALDAARYRWLKENIREDYELSDTNPCPYLSDDSTSWDLTIDAAMLAAAPQGDSNGTN